MKRQYRITIDFSYSLDEDLEALSDRVIEAVTDIIDPGCDGIEGETVCPRDWFVHEQDVTHEYNNPV